VTEFLKRALAAVEVCQTETAAAYAAAGVAMPDYTAALLEPTSVAPVRDNGGWADQEPPEDPDAYGAGDGGDDDSVPDNVRDHPTREGDTLPWPERPMEMDRGLWYYELGGPGRRKRGVYEWVDGMLRLRQPLPYVRSRIVRRDGDGRVTGYDYLVAGTEDGPAVVIDHEEVSRHTWANRVGLPLAQSPRLLQAAATAFFDHADKDAEVIEATPRLAEDGTLSMSAPETLPAGYLSTAAVDRAAGIEVWSQLLTLVAKSPRMALVLGASAIAPFQSALDLQAHIVSLYGDAAQGKSTSMRAAASMWGYPGAKSQAGLCKAWNTTKLVVPRYLGEIGLLPAFFDEIGMASHRTPAEWGKAIYEICEGASRLGVYQRGRTATTLPWYGILFSAGNGRMGDGLGAGKSAGVPRRLVELSTPLTVDREHAKAIDQLVPQAYGHLGQEILAQFQPEAVRPLMAVAAEKLGPPPEGSEEYAEHIYGHLAGALMLDKICGHEDRRLFTAALEAAVEYLSEWAPPKHDADRVIEAIRDAMASEPSRWPTEQDYKDSKKPDSWSPDGGGAKARMPMHGVDRVTEGITWDDPRHGPMVAVIGRYWKQMCLELDIDSAVACRELEKRGVLHRTDRSRRAHEWTTKRRSLGTNAYVLQLPDDEDEDAIDGIEGGNGGGNGGGHDAGGPSQPSGGQQTLTPQNGSADVGGNNNDFPGSDPRRSGSVPGTGEASGTPLTCDVPDVPGVPGEMPRVYPLTREGEFSGGEPADSGSASPESGGESPMLTRSDLAGRVEDLEPEAPRPPCEICGRPAGQLVDGRPLHFGHCAGTALQATTGTTAVVGSEVLVKLAEPLPCVVCDELASNSINGRPMHAGDCALQQPNDPTDGQAGGQESATSDSAPSSPTSATAGPAAGTTAAATTGATAGSSEGAASASPTSATGAVEDVDLLDQIAPDGQDEDHDKVGAAPGAVRPAADAKAGREPRWLSPLVVVDEEQLHLPGGQVAPWPKAYDDLGDLAMVAHRDQLRLGHGGGETLPEAGQIWITSPATLARLGFPEHLELPDDIDDMDTKQSRAAIREALSAYQDLPVVAQAIGKGWEIGDLDAWVYLKHPELLPGGARLVFMPWIRSKLRNTPLLSESTTVEELADNLADAAHAFGVQFLIHAGITAHNLINTTRPPRRDPHGISGENTARVAAVEKTPAELPAFYRNGRDSRFTPVEGEAFTAVESDFSWWRPWDVLSESERTCEYVHAYDRKASYLTEWGSQDFGVEGLVHQVGEAAAWDGSETAGLFLVEHDWGQWPEPMLPEPHWDAVVGSEDGSPRIWMTTPTMVMLTKIGITPTVAESYTWQVHARYLQQAADRLRQARLHTNPAVAATAKQLYAVGTGRFGRTDGAFSHDPLWRPDWYDHIRAGARLKIMLTLLKIRDAAGITPLAAGRDSILFASDERDPVKAWPGEAKKLGNTPGMWAPEASGLLAEWGPEHLTTKGRGFSTRWRSTRAMDALTSHKRGQEW
jgi:hypothetical protein